MVPNPFPQVWHTAIFLSLWYWARWISNWVLPELSFPHSGQTTFSSALWWNFNMCRRNRLLPFGIIWEHSQQHVTFRSEWTLTKCSVTWNLVSITPLQRGHENGWLRSSKACKCLVWSCSKCVIFVKVWEHMRQVLLYVGSLLGILSLFFSCLSSFVDFDWSVGSFFLYFRLDVVFRYSDFSASKCFFFLGEYFV